MTTGLTLEALIEEAKDRNPHIQLLGAVPAIETALEDAKVAEREQCAKALELSTQELLLLAGEMTAQELRTVKAVLANRAAVIRTGNF